MGIESSGLIKEFLWQPRTERKIQEQLQEINNNVIPKLMFHVTYAEKRGYFS